MTRVLKSTNIIYISPGTDKLNPKSIITSYTHNYLKLYPKPKFLRFLHWCSFPPICRQRVLQNGMNLAHRGLRTESQQKPPSAHSQIPLFLWFLFLLPTRSSLSFFCSWFFVRTSSRRERECGLRTLGPKFSIPWEAHSRGGPFIALKTKYT